MLPPLFLTAYVYTAVRLYRMLPQTMGLRIVLILLFIPGIAGVILFFIGGPKIPVVLAGGLYRFSTSWLIAFFYLFIFVLLIDIFRLLNGAFHLKDRETMHAAFSNNIATSATIFGLVVLLLLLGNIRYHRKEREPIEIVTHKIAKPVRIVGISDLHIGYTISAREVAKWVDLINAEKPDMVIIAGDIIDNHLRVVVKDSVEAVLQQIDAPIGCLLLHRQPRSTVCRERGCRVLQAFRDHPPAGLIIHPRWNHPDWPRRLHQQEKGTIAKYNGTGRSIRVHPVAGSSTASSR